MANIMKNLFGKKDEHIYYAYVSETRNGAMRLTIWVENRAYPARSHPEFVTLITEDVFDKGSFLLVKYENSICDVVTEMDRRDMPDELRDTIVALSE